MIVKEYTIQSAERLHTPAATTLVRLAKNFKSSIQIKKEEKQMELNSLLNVLGLTLKFGDSISLIIDGIDEAEVAEAMESFFKEQLVNL